MYNPLTIEMAQERQDELHREAAALHQVTVAQHDTLSSSIVTLIDTLTHHQKPLNKAEEAAHQAWLADQA